MPARRPLLLLAGVALGLVLAGPVGASEGDPAYPPGAGVDEVIQAGEGTDTAGSGGTTATTEPAEVGGAETAENPDPDDADGPATEDQDGASTAGAAPVDDGRGMGPILVVAGTAVLLAAAVVAIARRI